MIRCNRPACSPRGAPAALRWCTDRAGAKVCRTISTDPGAHHQVVVPAPGIPKRPGSGRRRNAAARSVRHYLA